MTLRAIPNLLAGMRIMLDKARAAGAEPIMWHIRFDCWKAVLLEAQAKGVYVHNGSHVDMVMGLPVQLGMPAGNAEAALIFAAD